MNNQSDVLDIVAELVEQMSYTGVMDSVMKNERTRSPYFALRDHPLFKDAQQRRTDKYWENLRRLARRIQDSPSGKKELYE